MADAKQEPTAEAPKAAKKGSIKASPKNTTIRMDHIMLPDDWNREKLGDISGLVASIKEEGLHVPLIVRPTDKAGWFMLVDGRRRFAALQKLETVSVMVTFSKARNDGKAFLQSMVANLAREDNTPFEIATSFGKLVTDYKMTNEKIAKACSRTPGYVSQHLAVLKADKKLQTALKKNTVSLAVFRHFARLDQKEDAEFYDKMMGLAFSGTSAQDLGDKIDTFLLKKEEKAAKAAKAQGKKAAPKAAKKGAAAHKKKKAPKLQIPDYKAEKVAKTIKMITKKDAIEWLDSYREKALEASTSRKRDYYQGVLEGMEIMTGLLKES